MKGWIPALLVLAGLAVAAPAVAVPPQPIAEGPDAASLPQFFGQPATPRPVAVPDPPRRRTVYKRLAGEGLGHNNNYAPVTLGPVSYTHLTLPTTPYV